MSSIPAVNLTASVVINKIKHHHAAVSIDGMMLKRVEMFIINDYYSDSRRFNKINYRDLCMAAVTQNGLALQFAHMIDISKSELIKRTYDFELFQTAVRQNGFALKYVPKEVSELFYGDAVKQNGNAISLIPIRRRTQDLCELAYEANEESVEYFPSSVVEIMRDRFDANNSNSDCEYDKTYSYDNYRGYDNFDCSDGCDYDDSCDDFDSPIDNYDAYTFQC